MYHLRVFPLIPICYWVYHAPIPSASPPKMTIKPRTLYTLPGRRPIRFTIWANEDFDAPGLEITMHYKDMKSWNSALNYLTSVLDPRFGAVRKLYDLESQQAVLCLQDIKPGGKYVATGAGKFKFRKNGYVTEDEKIARNKRRVKSANRSSDEIAKNTVDFMDYTKKYKRTVIHVMVSGRPCQTPLKVVLIERDLLDYNMVLEYLAYRLDVQEGVNYLANAKGKIILDPFTLKHGGLYVAVPFGTKFTKMDYKGLCSEMLASKKGELMASFMKKKKKKKKMRLFSKVLDNNLETSSSPKQDSSHHDLETSPNESELDSDEETELVKSEPTVVLSSTEHATDVKCICLACTHDACKKPYVDEKEKAKIEATPSQDKQDEEDTDSLDIEHAEQTQNPNMAFAQAKSIQETQDTDSQDMQATKQSQITGMIFATPSQDKHDEEDTDSLDIEHAEQTQIPNMAFAKAKSIQETQDTDSQDMHATKQSQITGMIFEYPSDFEKFVVGKEKLQTRQSRETHQAEEQPKTGVKKSTTSSALSGDLLFDDITKESTMNVEAFHYSLTDDDDEPPYAVKESSNNLTTFADIARDRELRRQQEIEESQMDAQKKTRRSSSCSFNNKKSVTFPQADFPVPIRSEREFSDESTITVNMIRKPKMSILKQREPYRGSSIPSAIPSVSGKNKNFGRVRDSIRDEALLRRMSNSLRQKLSLNIQENDDEEDQVSRATTSFPVKSTFSDPNLLELHADKGVQKHWRTEDRVDDKNTQVGDEYLDTDSEHSITDLLFRNQAHDEVSTYDGVNFVTNRLEEPVDYSRKNRSSQTDKDHH